MDRDGSMAEIGRFLLPLGLNAASRVDLHPRWSRDGNSISIDAGFSGVRRNYLLDVSGLTPAAPPANRTASR